MAWNRTRLEEEKEKDKREIISVSLNKEERQLLDGVKVLLNLKNDSRAMKVCLIIASNVIHNFLGDRLTKYLFKKDRVKYDD